MIEEEISVRKDFLVIGP